jgi:Mrp family chromosome partitioning ATPase
VTRWLAARARNALRRPLRIIGVSSTAFIAALLTLILIPREATRTASRMLDAARHRPDTLALTAQVKHLRADEVAAETALVRRRVRAAVRRRAIDDSVRALAQPRVAHRRDSLTADRVELEGLMARATRSPLPASYRALGAARALQASTRVRALLDSLAVATTARDAMARKGAADPAYLGQMTRLTSIGRAVQDIAAARDSALRVDIAALTPALVRGLAARAFKDTIPARAHVDSLRRALRSAESGLTSVRRLDAVLDVQMEQARAIASGSAPPLALMAAALVLGIAVGFAVTFGGELYTPRVSDAGEASRVAGVPTLATVTPREPDPQRMRRSSDQTVSPLIDINSESYRYVYLSVSDRAAAAALGFPLVAVTGDEAEVVATVAANVALASAHDSRTTLVIDADADAAAMAGILGVARAPGVTDVLSGRADWAGITVTAAVGRDRFLSVMPAGTAAERGPAPGAQAGGAKAHERTGAVGPSVDASALRSELIRLGRRYDLVVIAAPAGAAQVGPDSILPVQDAVVCVRVAYTRLTRLVAAIATLHESGLRVRGIVLWDADVPPRLTES